MTSELNINKDALTGITASYAKINDENKALKLKLDVQDEMKQLVQKEKEEPKSTGAQILKDLSTGSPT
jgi:hypothetical protein